MACACSGRCREYPFLCYAADPQAWEAWHREQRRRRLNRARPVVPIKTERRSTDDLTRRPYVRRSKPLTPDEIAAFKATWEAVNIGIPRCRACGCPERTQSHCDRWDCPHLLPDRSGEAR